MLPDAYKGNGDDAFVEHSIVTRLPDILMSVLEKNPELFPARSKSWIDIKSFADELRGRMHRIRLIDSEDGGPSWSSFTGSKRLGVAVLDAEWMFVETYTYRLLLQFSGYFVNKIDPFGVHKDEALSLAMSSDFFQGELDRKDASDVAPSYDHFRKFVTNSLWGNQADLSHSSGKVNDESGKSQCLLIDDLSDCYEATLSGNLDKPLKVAVILDNCGSELLNDLLLADFILAAWSKSKITVFAKTDPIFVSDALTKDVYKHIECLDNAPKFTLQASRLKAAIRSGRLAINEHAFFCSPLPFFDMPDDLSSSLWGFDLVIIKGDANYRRLFDDRMFPHSASFQTLLSYWGANTNVLAIRTCKSPIAVGLSRSVLLEKRTPTWLVDGTNGMLSFYDCKKLKE